MKRTKNETEEHFRKRKELERERYYGKPIYAPRTWTQSEINMVMSGEWTDRVLSKMISRSPKAIQHCRARMKKGSMKWIN